MPNSLTENMVLKPARCCVARPQKDRYLFYNSQTDELHLIPPSGFKVYGLCDGSRTVNDIEQSIAQLARIEIEEIRAPIKQFLAKLLSRGILEVTDDA